MSPLNEYQARHVIATLRHVDGLLGEVGRLALADATGFADERRDLTSHEVRRLRAWVALARARLPAALDRLGIPRPPPTLSARRSIATALQFADIALSETGSSDLAGYGHLDAEGAAETDALVSELRVLIRHGMGLVSRSARPLSRSREAG